MKVLVPLAEGFEEIEAVTVIDVLRRAGLTVTTAALSGLDVKGSHGIIVKADTSLSECDPLMFDAIALPGGPGTKNLRESERVIEFIKAFIYISNLPVHFIKLKEKHLIFHRPECREFPEKLIYCHSLWCKKRPGKLTR